MVRKCVADLPKGVGAKKARPAGFSYLQGTLCGTKREHGELMCRVRLDRDRSKRKGAVLYRPDCVRLQLPQEEEQGVVQQSKKRSKRRRPRKRSAGGTHRAGAKTARRRKRKGLEMRNSVEKEGKKRRVEM